MPQRALLGAAGMEEVGGVVKYRQGGLPQRLLKSVLLIRKLRIGNT